MSDQPESPQSEDPRQKFRRLLSSGEEEEGRKEGELEPAEDKAGLFREVEPAPVSPEDKITQPYPPPEVSEQPIADSQGTLEEETPASRQAVHLPPPPLREESKLRPPALDESGMPLPRRVDEIDMEATRVAPVAYPSPPRKDAATRRTEVASTPLAPRTRPQEIRKTPPGQRVATRKEFLGVSWRTALGCLLRMMILGVFGLVILTILLGTIVLLEYYSVAATIPSVDDLRARASQFETTRILDRNGNTLYEILDPNAGRRTYVPLEHISPYLVAATIATEDKNFYSHPGFDPLAILRAFYQNWRSDGEVVSGASTITQQVARNLLFSPEERVERTYRRKVREALAAAEITRRYSKDEILEIYLNENYYGNLSYGVQAAAETYFKTTADKLTLGQAAFLAGLPQAPSIYDIYENREATLTRLQQVLTLMYQVSREQNCIAVSNNPQPICVDRETALEAYASIQNYPFEQPQISIRYPHWVNYIRSQLEAMYDAQTIYRSGFSVYTTIDPGLQDDAQRIVQEQVAKLAENRASNGALVAIRPSTGEILAMVGSVDFYNEAISGQVNMAISPTRQPGSTIKPITYLAAFEKGWTPATLIWDVKTDFPPSGDPNDPRPPYQPVNYDGQFHGPVLLRSALANSYNVPAVKTLQFVGIYDNPSTPEEDGMIAMARRLGITTLTRPDYGLSLTLGGGEVSLLELTGAYAVMANGGLKKPLVSISKILDHNGAVIFEYQPPVGEQVIRVEHAYLMSSILSDNAARTPAFGANSVLALPFPAAVKTGTTNDFRDNWTIGYTPDIAVGVWIGNSDYTPMQNTTGLTGAAPIWAQFMQVAIQKITGGNPSPFIRPPGIVDRVICAVSGTEPSQWCPSQKGEIFAADQLPLPKEKDLWFKGQFDTWTGLLASPACGEFTKEEFALNVTDPWAIKWILETSQGQRWAEEMGFKQPLLFVPPRECRTEDSRPLLEIISPREGETVSNSPVDIIGKADATSDFRRFELSYGLGSEPVEWKLLTASDQPLKLPDRIYTWDLYKDFPDALPSGPVTLRLRMESLRNTYAELLVQILLQVPTVTPTATATFTATPTATETLLPTLTSTVTPTASATPTPTVTPLPSFTPTVTLSPAPTTSSP